MKKFLTIFLALILCFITLSFAGCEEENSNGWRSCKVSEDVTLILVSYNPSYDILVHKETRVMYIVNSIYNQGGISVMLDENGKPLLWQGEL